ncbi:hypothetical protein CIP107539_00919 [Corynebacterium diphtheriae]|uniref:Uncharacterized protein n=1 Tax=Corynebacterium diphtheriae TaxID=1717 RepID=A0A811G3T3_CORDP|nr:hypothetical protein [Corynebacterium diphtheriae]OWO45783.1 hypothetical protein AY545_03105 [Corynebacterium belfantii]MBG9277909.1 hypothetical protein [Corynebacterium diphtheriae bv. mitis]MBG9282373.1 hypothetical protein [Corynebacterium diphtheriae bv. mitis]OWM42250.1 hypothetical protein BU159_03675 [Corynebacterium diphtheriae]OWM61699.1 hypothetical protein BU166_01605 [Corynebacterium diphtheriae]
MSLHKTIITIKTDHFAWSGTREELRQQFIELIPQCPDDDKLLELAAVALDCQTLDLIMETPS